MTRFPLIRLAAFLSAAMALTPAVRAGATVSPQGSLRGSVRTSDGHALAGVAVELRRAGAAPLRLITGADGGFYALGLPAGEYEARVDAPGLELSSPTRATVGHDEGRLDLVLAPLPVREQVVVSATRGEATLGSLGVASDVLDRERIEERDATELLSLLQEVPGVATSRTGGTGLQGSAFIRGGEARYARVLVDGVPVNQPGGSFDFGTVLPFELERVEVVRGAASSLYGSDALAGVISLTTRQAQPGEPLSLRGEAEGGSFSWQRYSGASAGSRGRFDWNAGVQHLATDNEQPNSRFEQTSVALSSGFRFDEATRGRLVARFEDGTVGTPGQTAFGRPDLDASFDRRDALVSASLRHAGTRLSQQLSLGWAKTRQLSLDPLDSGSFVPSWNGTTADPIPDFPDPAGFQNQTARTQASYQADLTLGARHLVTAGAEAERETGAIGERAQPPLLEPHRTNLGLYLQDRFLLGERAYLTAGGRVERNGSYGTRAVPRVALALRLRGGEDATTLRASAGLGIKEPSFLESYGVYSYAKGNPDLKPERSATADVGLEQRLFGSRLRASVTAFHHDYRDQIAYTLVDPASFQGTYVNLAHTRSRGVEAELEARPLHPLRLLGQYTYQQGTILESPSDFDPIYAVGQPLLRRPAHQAAFSAAYTFPRGTLGATVVYVGERADSDFVGLGLTTNAAYTRVDARARLRLVGPLEAVLAADNLTGARYQEVLGYPALGRTVRAGVRVLAGGGR